MEGEHLGPISDQTSAIKGVLGLAVRSEDAPITKVPREVSHPPGLGPIAVFNLEYGHMKFTTLSAGVQAPFRHIQRQVRPRARLADFFDPLTENYRASNSLSKHSDGVRIDPKLSWVLSDACRMLRPGPSQGGLWIPHWTGYVTQDPAERRLLAWILFLYDDKSSNNPDVGRNRRRKGKDRDAIREMSPEQLSRYDRVFLEGARGHRCRAFAWRDVTFRSDKSIDGEHVRCVELPLDDLAASTGLSRNTCRRKLAGLIAKEAIFRCGVGGVELDNPSKQPKGITLFPNAYVLAQAYLKGTGDDYEKVPTTLAFQMDWYGSKYRREAMNRDGRTYYPSFALDEMGFEFEPTHRKRAPGTFVPDLLYAACGEDPGVSHLAAQLLFHCGRYRVRHEDGTLNPDDELCKAVVKREGRRWTVRSDRRLAEELGYSARNIGRWSDVLATALKFFDKRSWLWHGWNSSERGVSHYSPNPDVIRQSLVKSESSGKRAVRYAI